MGQGAIRHHLARHRKSETVTHYGKGSLLVTWAACLAHSRDGVVRFLADAY